ncbi:hypothetical protein HPODL_00418 [Ogataea parapolymorpha DL-1]|uniref:non-specific serine/threonine protein kinase n=1 Tax=Ogataea parapolymorpha (strain ATCC 26012 / BCRC 20466 / JCM 22074 / NRRL Y-7560 / DL-1) TaxID=871575 RepID=W1QG07_OGAPD|nr:hypothetical protein HPODL_00418 [Ogataea parapolymorpha DL-1]ESX01007.1 hypothetical protein HPODL_00418 [Ogataea parapolymorpha DL-1]KAG7870751.1 hypothetical protein KL916_004640 [Ogataea parapolymorpha]
MTESNNDGPDVDIKVPVAREFVDINDMPSAEDVAQAPSIDSVTDSSSVDSKGNSMSRNQPSGGALHMKKLREPGNIHTKHNDRTTSDVHFDDRRNFSLNIEPVQRIVSVPLRPPEWQQTAYNLQSTDSISEDTEYGKDVVATFCTLETATHVKQYWHCTKEIGRGTFSIVYIDQSETVAVKVSNIPSHDPDTRLRIQSSLVRELSLLQSINHPNIVKLLGSNSRLDKNQVIMAMPYYSGGDLFTLLVTLGQNFTYHHKKLVFRNIVSAVKCLHDMNICHRDIKLENILLAPTPDEFRNASAVELDSKYEHSVAVLSDFGLSKKIDPQQPLLTTRCGSEDYVSPELLLGLAYDGKQNDCWSLGVLLYAMLENRLPFDPLPNSTGRGRRSAKPAHRIATLTWGWYHYREHNMDQQGNDWGPAKRVVEMLLVKRDERADINTVSESEWCSWQASD